MCIVEIHYFLTYFEMPTISTEMANSLVTNLGTVTTSLFDSLIALSPFLLTLAGFYFVWRLVKRAVAMKTR